VILNGNKIKHISKMKTDMKLFARSFSVASLPVFSAWSRSSLMHMHDIRQLSAFPFFFRVFCEVESGLYSVADRAETLHFCFTHI
jgi:hypothetical protein